MLHSHKFLSKQVTKDISGRGCANHYTPNGSPPFEIPLILPKLEVKFEHTQRSRHAKFYEGVTTAQYDTAQYDTTNPSEDENGVKGHEWTGERRDAA
jgi:hypothetical protein